MNNYRVYQKLIRELKAHGDENTLCTLYDMCIKVDNGEDYSLVMREYEVDVDLFLGLQWFRTHTFREMRKAETRGYEERVAAWFTQDNDAFTNMSPEDRVNVLKKLHLFNLAKEMYKDYLELCRRY